MGWLWGFCRLNFAQIQQEAGKDEPSGHDVTLQGVPWPIGQKLGPEEVLPAEHKGHGQSQRGAGWAWHGRHHGQRRRKHWQQHGVVVLPCHRRGHHRNGKHQQKARQGLLGVVAPCGPYCQRAPQGAPCDGGGVNPPDVRGGTVRPPR